MRCFPANIHGAGTSQNTIDIISEQEDSMRKKLLIISIVAIVYCCCHGETRADVEIDADYPGGNIIVNQINGDDIKLSQDLRDTKGWWFYWNFRVRGAEGKTLTFNFTNGDVMGTSGPAISLDDGLTWSWLGKEIVKGNSFSYCFAPHAKNIRFAFTLPYLEADLNRFLAQHKESKHVIVRELCKTRKGRSVEQIHIGNLEGRPEYRVLLTCRHHSCESVASYVIEGIMAGLLANTDDGKWFRTNVEVLVLPFMDKDGVEDGDQGKNRQPKDHNRDYDNKSLYPAVNAVRTTIPKWADERLKIIFDLHCPYVREDKLYLVGSSNEATWKEQCRFSEILESIPDKSLTFNASNNIPFGESWNTANNYSAGKSFSRWADELEYERLVSSVEIPYANSSKTVITPETARAFGADLVKAMRLYLEQL